MATDNEAKIWAVMGQSGTGKGLWIKMQLRRLKPKRIIIVDPMDEYGEFASPFTRLDDLASMVLKAPGGGFRVRYVFPKDCTQAQYDQVFAYLCTLAFVSGNCVFLVEELSNFTKPSWGPPNWKKMCNGGRHEAMHVIGCSQYPAQVDKAFLSNATLVHCGWLGEEPHRKAMATKMNITAEDINQLKDLHYIEWERKGRTLKRGVITTTGRVKEEPFSA